MPRVSIFYLPNSTPYKGSLQCTVLEVKKLYLFYLLYIQQEGRVVMAPEPCPKPRIMFYYQSKA